ncbi:MAG: type II secretion system F family protein [Saccharofermentanales bacterium]|jgi:Flp pilus assembly protein TadB|nr:type II secretion system F family protein [Bacillota bacterium]
MSKLKHFIKHLIPTLFFVYLTSLTWINLENLEIIILGISTIIIGFGLSKFMSGRTASVKIEQYKILLEYLSSRLSAGHTLESSLLEASERLADELGRKSTLAKCLKQLNQGMQAQLNLERCLRILKEQFNCKTSESFFDVLPYLNHYGGRLDIYVKQTHRTLNAEIQMQKDISAEQNAQNSEAIVLMFLPFLFSLVLIKNSSSYAGSLADVSWSKPLLAIIFVVSQVAIAWTLIVLAQNPENFKEKDVFLKLKGQKPKSKIISACAQFTLIHTPSFFGYRLANTLRILSHDKPNAWLLYIKRKIILIIIVGLISGILCILEIIAWSLLSVILLFTWFMPDLDLIQRENKLKQQIRIEYPNFLNSMVILLRSGISLDRSLRLMIESYRHNINSQLKSDLDNIKQMLSLGETASFALLQITDNLPQEEIASVLQLMARYDRDGGQEILDILDLQANASWQLYRNAMRRRLQTQNMGLLFPMAIDLFIVIIMAMLPAIASLSSMQI